MTVEGRTDLLGYPCAFTHSLGGQGSWLCSRDWLWGLPPGASVPQLFPALPW